MFLKQSSKKECYGANPYTNPLRFFPLGNKDEDNNNNDNDDDNDNDNNKERMKERKVKNYIHRVRKHLRPLKRNLKDPLILICMFSEGWVDF